MNIKLCDRCKKDITKEPPLTEFAVAKQNCYEGSYYCNLRRYDPDQRAFIGVVDLCHDCASDLKFMIDEFISSNKKGVTCANAPTEKT